MPRYALIFDTKAEFDEAEALLASRRSSIQSTDAVRSTAMAKKLEAALSSSPLNPQKATVLKTWLAAPSEDWVPYPVVVQAFIDMGIGDSAEQATNRASAAIRDLSFQVSQTLSATDLSGFDKAIEALASRSRSAGIFSYRLTPEGRAATEKFLSKTGAS
jgi:Tfp pilus assembly protein PilX